MTLKGQIKVSIFFEQLYLQNGASQPQKGYYQKIGSHMWTIISPHDLGPWKVKSRSRYFQTAVSSKRCFPASYLLLTTDRKSYVNFHFPSWPLTLVDLERSNHSRDFFKQLYLQNGASQPHKYYCQQIGSHKWTFISPHDLWPWMTLKGLIKVMISSNSCI